MPHNFWLTKKGKRLPEELREVMLCQPWSHEFFDAINSGIPVCGWEAIFLRRDISGELEVLLIDRDPTDNNFAGSTAIPGSIPRNTDVIFGRTSDEIDTIVLNRIFLNELKLSERQIAQISITNCGVVTWRHVRGGSISNCFICFANELEVPVGKWHQVKNLPDNLLGGQGVVIYKGVSYVEDHPDTIPAI